MGASLGLVLAVVASGAPAAETPWLTETRQVRRLSAAEAAERRPVRLHAVVTYHHRFPGWNPLFVQDATGGIYVEVASGLDLAPGDRIVVEGVSGPGMFAPLVLEPQIRVEGRGPLPAPARRTLDELLQGASDSLWIEIEGVVRRLESVPGSGGRDRLYALTLADAGGHPFRAIVRTSDASPPPTGLVDARVRIQGAAGTAFTRKRQIVDIQLLIPGFERVGVVEPARSDPFDQPVHRVAQLFQFDPDGVSGHRVRVQGSVTAQGPGGAVYVRDDSGGLRIELDAAPPRLQAGDVLDVAGFPERGEYSPVLKNATARVLRQGTLPAPELIDAQGALTGDHDSLPVQIDGVLVDQAPERGGARLLLKSGEHTFPVEVERGHPKGLSRGSVLRVTGLCLVQAGPDNRVHGFRIAADSARDVAVLKPGRWWTLERALWTVVALGLGLVTGLVWILKLRRRESGARANVKVLSGLLPICAWCKKIRDDQGYWSQVENYIHDHSEADFSHGICPDCVARERVRHREEARPH
jgi:hypothetical protein